MRHYDPLCDSVPQWPKRKREADDIHHQCVAVHLFEPVVVLKVTEPASTHCVLKEGGSLIPCDQGLVHGRDAELPSAPYQPIIRRNETAGLSLNRSQAERLLNEVYARCEQKAPIDRCLHVNAFF